MLLYSTLYGWWGSPQNGCFAADFACKYIGIYIIPPMIGGMNRYITRLIAFNVGVWSTSCENKIRHALKYTPHIGWYVDKVKNNRIEDNKQRIIEIFFLCIKNASPAKKIAHPIPKES